MKISLIVAMANHRMIGNAGTIPWRLPEDLRWFREQTMGHHLLMGRRTFESIGAPLSGRHAIILSRNPDYQAPRCQVAPDLDTALALVPDGGELFVCGGGEIYRQTLPLAYRLYLTLLDLEVEGDTCFPEFDPAEFDILHQHNISGKIDQTYQILQRRTSPVVTA